MSKLFNPPKSIPVGSFLYRNDLISKEELVKLWTDYFMDFELKDFDFCPMKDYYSKEMGDISKLSRFFIYSKKPTNRNSLVKMKLWADQLEIKYSDKNNRIFNLDVGLLSPENFILATGKPYSHRIYVDSGVYMELTYIFENKTFNTLPWTYPDYALKEIILFFNSLRIYTEKFTDIT